MDFSEDKFIHIVEGKANVQTNVEINPCILCITVSHCRSDGALSAAVSATILRYVSPCSAAFTAMANPCPVHPFISSIHAIADLPCFRFPSVVISPNVAKEP